MLHPPGQPPRHAHVASPVGKIRESGSAHSSNQCLSDGELWKREYQANLHFPGGQLRKHRQFTMGKNIIVSKSRTPFLSLRKGSPEHQLESASLAHASGSQCHASCLEDAPFKDTGKALSPGLRGLQGAESHRHSSPGPSAQTYRAMAVLASPPPSPKRLPDCPAPREHVTCPCPLACAGSGFHNAAVCLGMPTLPVHMSLQKQVRGSCEWPGNVK